MAFENIDLQCSLKAAEIVKGAKNQGDWEDLVNRASATLALHGPYAFFLYLEAKKGDEARKLKTVAYGLLKEQFSIKADRVELPTVAAEFSNDLPKLLLARKLLSQTLVYLKYHVKTLEKGK